MTELEHLQSVILSITKDIEELCKSNSIEYYLSGGSCIGAIRHKGFIPWDDDLDIMMTRENYVKFLKVCREQLDRSKYYVQEGKKDWPLDFSKIRLKGTYLHEPEDEYATKEMHGIYVDVFALDNVPDSNLLARIQYFLAKYYLCYQLGQRHYKNASLKKKLMIMLSAPMKIGALRKWVVNFIESFNQKETKRLALFCANTRFNTAIASRDIYGKPQYVEFEDTQLPIPENYHEYLTQAYGDYMQLPPIEDRQGPHLISIDFGKY